MRKFIASLMALSMVAGMGVSTFALTAYNDDEDKAPIIVESQNIRPDTTYWIPVYELGVDATDWNKGTINDLTRANELGDTDLFKWSFDKDGEGRSLIKSITVVNDKKLDQDKTANGVRTTYLKVVTNQTFDDGEKKAKIDIEIKPRKSKGEDYDVIFKGQEKVDTSEKATASLTLWVSNVEENGDDVDVETGDGFVFIPADNEENTIVYGDDRAALFFYADDDADKFYAKLSTKAMMDIYTEYGDPADADLWFYDFVGNKTIPSTSRATLTLGIPWDEDDTYVPDPTNVYIYELKTDGSLVDVTDKFTYSEDNDSTTGIEGWTIKTRTLGTYIVSDAELML